MANAAVHSPMYLAGQSALDCLHGIVFNIDGYVPIPLPTVRQGRRASLTARSAEAAASAERFCAKHTLLEGKGKEMRMLMSAVSIISVVAVPIVWWAWYFQVGQDVQAPQDLKLGALVAAILVTLFSAFLVLSTVPQVQTALASRNQGVRVTLNVINWLFVIAFALLALYFLRLYLNLTR